MTPEGKNSSQASLSTLDRALVWCLAWGPEQIPQYPLDDLKAAILALENNKPDDVPADLQRFVDQVTALSQLPYPKTQSDLQALLDNPSPSSLWTAKIGLVYGGATKIKTYVFEGSKLPEVRGASALLDRINLVDLPVFFGKKVKIKNYEQVSLTIQEWLKNRSEKLAEALIPDLIIYSTGGNILAFCPPAFVDELADAIEARYGEETLTANSCAVGERFRLLELRLGCLQGQVQGNKAQWWQENLETLHPETQKTHGLVASYFRHHDQPFSDDFQSRKSFNELVTKLAIAFNQRRSGGSGLSSSPHRLSRRYPPMLETHPYLLRDEYDRRSAIARPEATNTVDNKTKISEVLARKRVVGAITKRQDGQGELPAWFKCLQSQRPIGEDPWQPLALFFESWVQRFERSFKDTDTGPGLCSQEKDRYHQGHLVTDVTDATDITEARSLREIGNVTDPGQGFVAYIYADGNNIGGYIQGLKTPQDYQRFSKDISEATEQAVYLALAKHLQVREIQGLSPDEDNRNGSWIHPFEIVTIGGDDVFLVVPADQALAIAQSIGEEFEKILIERNPNYQVKGSVAEQDSLKKTQQKSHHYNPLNAPPSNCHLSMSIGVLITGDHTPIYYAQNLVEQLLKSAKQRAKVLKKEYHYYGGTIDFMVLKSVTMISSKISSFRKQALEIDQPASSQNPKAKNHSLKLYGGPYTLHEIGGLLKTLAALKQSEFPKSQLYQIRSFLAQGKRTAMLNYRYFRTRLKAEKGNLLKTNFEGPWCEADSNSGNLAPWMSSQNKKGNTVYTTILRDLVDLLPFCSYPAVQSDPSDSTPLTTPEINP
ncbi:type III-B CRISPR-associated protein Cas10/Cmr2 [Prochlorothrix hollandica]|uniref:Cas10/Cmr2 second palm domain-containing protein n=1 Tax=Prochlorothrix hollandica PCC 9006 = CALU 1027 TaxID=317619 RepID=A0A0M2PTS4_PROHO|nr:type III-B CRISPR-associated protein Cas10/Cmr2 [Prochlorothrix hollandica]KKI99900.1 hypothetical protein PROH_08830 [Prochlorothrix hollandica PCC 9006 = CALU 1027]